MSTKGIYTAVSGAIAQSKKLDTIANNLANVNTPAFKRDQQKFREYLTSYEKIPEVIEATRIPASIQSFYPLNGGDKSYVDTSGTTTSFGQGALKVTNNAFDIALDGKGFFEVLTPQGVRWTRNGSFSLNKDGLLVTKQGHPVLLDDAGGRPIDERMVKLDEARKLNVTFSGEIFSNNESLGQISLKNISDQDALHKEGASLYSLRDNINYQVIKPKSLKVIQGSMELSNVNIVSEMTEMIKTTRLFESLQKAIQAYDQMNGRLVNDVPKNR